VHYKHSIFYGEGVQHAGIASSLTMGGTGLAQTSDFKGQNAIRKMRAAKSDANLARIIAAWPKLPEPIRKAILALIDVAALTV
jgi:hypothetical protein